MRRIILSAIAALVAFSASATTTTNLPSALTPLGGTEVFPMDQSGVTRKATILNLYDFVAARNALAGAVQTLTDATTIAWDVSLGYNAKITLTANSHTMGNPTNVVAGQTYRLQILPVTYSLTGWGNAYAWGGAGAPSLTANKINLITCFAVAASGADSLLCTAALGF